MTGSPVCSPLTTGWICPAGLRLQTGVRAASTTRSCYGCCLGCSAATVPGIGGGAGEVGGVGLPESTGGQARVDGLTLPATAQHSTAERGQRLHFQPQQLRHAQGCEHDQRAAEKFPRDT